MKKIPTLFKREFENHKVKKVLPEITEGCEDAFLHGIATIKIDGACCAIIDGKFYKRFDAKKGRKIPEGAIPCCEPDPVTGHNPHWVLVSEDNPNDKWFRVAKENTHSLVLTNSGFLNSPQEGNVITFEAIGPHFQGNPERLPIDMLNLHGCAKVEVERTFEGVKQWLTDHKVEGLVFWLDHQPVCKIKRSDFGMDWNVSH